MPAFLMIVTARVFFWPTADRRSGRIPRTETNGPSCVRNRSFLFGLWHVLTTSLVGSRDTLGTPFPFEIPRSWPISTTELLRRPRYYCSDRRPVLPSEAGGSIRYQPDMSTATAPHKLQSCIWRLVHRATARHISFSVLQFAASLIRLAKKVQHEGGLSRQECFRDCRSLLIRG